jgi:peptide/nickel transport system permease protein
LTTYIIRRLLQSLLVIILVTILVFLIMRMLPGDPAYLYLTQQEYSRITEEQLAKVRHEYGLDRPIYIQYTVWFSDLLHGNLGESIIKKTPVTDSIREALPISLHLGILAFLVSHIVGIPLGIICAIRRGSWLDMFLTILANIGITAPAFWLGILLIYVFGVGLGWLPTHGYFSPIDDLWLNTKQIVMPVFCLALFPLSGATRQTRSAMLEVIGQDFIRTAWSKGLSERAVIVRHALKNGILPVITMAGMATSTILGGEVIIETVFSIPGMGKTAVDALLNRDYPIVQGVILVVAIAVVLTNLIVDIAYSWLDPRIRY